MPDNYSHPRDTSAAHRSRISTPRQPRRAREIAGAKTFQPPLLVIAALFLAFTSIAAPLASLRSGFLNPPDSAKPHTWWHWMNGNITKTGITADLEAMKQIGLGGATIVNVDCDIPAGPVTFMSPAWRENFKFAIQEANRLGLKLCVENCAGWSSSGGPWNTVTNAMQCLTAKEISVHGPDLFNAILPQPETTLNYYRDIAVLAYPAPADIAPADGVPPSAGGLEIKHAVYQSQEGPAGKDVTAKIIALIKAGKTSVGANNEEMGGDPASGEVKQLHVDFVLDGQPGTLNVDEDGRLIFPVNARQLALARKMERSSINSTFVRPPPANDLPATEAIPRDQIVDLTSHLHPDGRLRWNVPPGNWIILRVGYTPVGVDNHPAPKEGTGLECDKMSKTALDAHWNGFMQKVLNDLGPLGGTTLNASLIDSYEVGNQDWTPRFREEFKKRRGYDPLKFLPTFTRRIVDNPAVTARFLWDMRRTVSDLFAEDYYGHFAELCHQHGLLDAIEPYTGPFESMQCGAPADLVMGEFWAGSQGNPTVKLAASIAHVYGKTIVGAESFTAAEDAGRWQNDPYSFKALGDLMFCQGLNRYFFHRYAMQPWTNRWPGMTMGPWGFQFERTETWWTQGKAWIDYISRCEFLLQQGRAVADVGYFTGETAPVVMRAGTPPLPPGYDYDAVNPDVLLHGARVKNGRITLASGANYAILILPPGDPNLTPPLLARLRQLVRAGATIVGTPPSHSPSLEDYPQCDNEVKKLADELWGNCDGSTTFEHRDGAGRVIWGKSPAEVFAGQKLPPDFAFTGASSKTRLAYVHRVAGGSDIYFVSNQRQQFDSADCLFRVTGKTPELWHPDTGLMEPAAIWNTPDGLTKVRLNFDPAGSVFVLFRPVAAPVNHVTAAGNGPGSDSNVAPQLKIDHAVYAASDGAGSMDVTRTIADLADDGQLDVVASSSVMGGDPTPNHVKELRVDYTLDGKPGHAVARENATLTVPATRSYGRPPQWETMAAPTTPVVKAWRNGRMELPMADGKTLQAVIRDLPAPQEISGPWNLSFPPHWGAPPSTTLDQLISWADHTNPGVRYFSGTATYDKTIEISAERLSDGRELWLDLGAVKNFAEVSLNGRDFGVLWKPPFRVNVTGAATPGANHLVVKVTNLWPNRLIGDEQLPPDREWNGNALKAWPQWFLDGKPSPTGRLTFATWHFWKQDSQLLESGLIGPVTLRTAELVTPAP